ALHLQKLRKLHGAQVDQALVALGGKTKDQRGAGAGTCLPPTLDRRSDRVSPPVQLSSVRLRARHGQQKCRRVAEITLIVDRPRSLRKCVDRRKPLPDIVQSLSRRFQSV